jgi:hypothetical protein
VSKAIGGYVRRGDRRYVPPVPDDGTRRVLGDRYCDDSENHAWGCVCAAGPYATFWTMMATSNGGETLAVPLVPAAARRHDVSPYPVPDAGQAVRERAARTPQGGLMPGRFERHGRSRWACPDFRSLTAPKRASIDTETAVRRERFAASRARFRKPVITGPQGYRRRKAG